jgi:GNAT superfamily N-acetyltransferase
MALVLNQYGRSYYSEFPFNEEDACESSIIISHGVEIYPQFRGQGHGSRLHAERLEEFRSNGYALVLCTVRRDNEPQLAILRKNGWVKLINTASASGSPIYLMGKNLK